MFRPRRNANPREWAKHGVPKLEGYLAGQPIRLAATADARVFDAVASGQWLVNEPVRSPARPLAEGSCQEPLAVSQPISR